MSPHEIANFFIHIPRKAIEDRRAKDPDFIAALLPEGVWLEEIFIVNKKKMQELLQRHRPSNNTNNEQQKPDEPSNSILQPIKNFAGSMKNWVAHGMPMVSKEVYDARKAICNSCPFWDKDGNMGMGKCTQCGCTSAKLNLATEKCPVGKWGPEIKD